MNTRISNALLSAIAALALVAPLTACSSTTASGTFYGESGRSNIASIIEVDGDSITWGHFSCDTLGEVNPDSDKTSIGTLDQSRTTVAWTQAGQYSGSDPYTESDGGDVITMSGFTYSKVGTPAGDTLLADQKESCEAEAEREKADEVARAKQAQADEKIRAQFEQTVRDLIAREDFETLDGSLERVIEANGLDHETFDSYLYRNYGYTAHDLDSVIFVEPDDLSYDMEFLN
ncbi:hypothetical protein EDF62_3072 [Leucobacter luti]|uniref:Lipoprotein n=1 Tax=Leucobacter luti TaxID=340320 RepID=A0A4R6RU29_9MICO|nr:hypothetical protein [Leucobacter luti]TDP89775.1 hypothetical protein EDF62_3072 [Leucobacter luti]